jgi:hypothetical protein
MARARHRTRNRSTARRSGRVSGVAITLSAESLEANGAGLLFAVERVGEELRGGGDELADVSHLCAGGSLRRRLGGCHGGHHAAASSHAGVRASFLVAA